MGATDDATGSIPVYLIGGTTEANRAAKRLAAEGFEVTVSVATELGAAPAAAVAGAVDAGPKQAAAIAGRSLELGAAAIIDCSHPYAMAASAESRSAARETGLPYLRYCRAPVSISGDKVTRVDSWEEAVRCLREREDEDRALLTVGTRHLEAFAAAGLDCVARILPVPESLAECRRLGIGPERIIAAYPPFTVDFNRACIRHAGAGILVTKESGQEGGLPEKAQAAAEAGIELLLVGRPPEPDAIHDLDLLVAALREAVSP